MADETVIEKKPNGVILVTTDGKEYTLKSNYRLQKNATDVEIRDDSGGSVAKFTASEVEKVILIDGAEVAIADIDTLFTQLHTNFFFVKSGLIGPTGDLEFISDANIAPGADGNYRLKMVAGKLKTQKLIAGVWTVLEEI